MRNDRKGSSFTESHLTYWTARKSRPKYPVVRFIKPVVACLIFVIIWSYL